MTTEAFTHEVVITGWQPDWHRNAAAVVFTKFWQRSHGEAVKVSEVQARMKYVTPETPFQWEVVQGAQVALEIVHMLSLNCGVQCHMKEIEND